MIPLTKFRVGVSLFEKDKVLLNNENAEFYIYQYHLEIQTQKRKKERVYCFDHRKQQFNKYKTKIPKIKKKISILLICNSN